MYYSSVRQTNNMYKKGMTVHGNGALPVEPNVAEVQLGVVVQDLQLQLVQQENAKIIQQVIHSLLQLGVSQENIQTTDYSIFPQYDYVDGNQQFKGYQVTHMLLITIENIDHTGAIIDTAVQNGANRVSNITFTIKNKDAYYRQALKFALEDALAKAQTIAKTMRLQLDPTPVSILEQTFGSPPTPHIMMSSSEIVGGVATPIEPGRLTIEAKVEVKFNYFS